MKRHLEIVFGAIFAAFALFGLWWLISYTLIGTIRGLMHSPVQASFGALVILLMWVALLSGTLLGVQAQHREEPRKHRAAFLHLRLHH